MPWIGYVHVCRIPPSFINMVQREEAPMALEITVASTPNPNSRKFVINQTVSSSTQWFANAAAAANNPMAAELFALGGVANVMLLNDFVTVGKDPGADWDSLVDPIKGCLEKHLGG